MKNLHYFLISFFLTSCAVTDYYQVFKVNSESGTNGKDKIVFEDKNCIVEYNLWEDGGDIGFKIFNKTDNDLTVDLTKTFFVLNGVAYEYFQNRIFSKTSSSGTQRTFYPYYYWYWQPSKITGTSSSSYSTSFNEKSELAIPSKTQIYISEYHIVNARYVNCDLLKTPSRSEMKTLKFDKSNSPFVFYNLITYRSKGDENRMENKFYVNEITNMPKSEIFMNRYVNQCGRKLDFPEKVFKDKSPDKFYFHYSVE